MPLSKIIKKAVLCSAFISIFSCQANVPVSFYDELAGNLNKSSGFTDADAVAADKAVLNVVYAGSESKTAVYNDLTLPTSGSNGTTITWSSDNASVNAAAGTVTQPVYPATDATVTLTATITKNGVSDTKVFVIIVKRQLPPMTTGQTQCWDDLGNLLGSCTGTGQDGELQKGRAPSFTGPTQHTTYTADYTTTDNATGLVWKTCPEGLSGPTCATGAGTVINWATATGSGTGCDALNSYNAGAGYAGKKNWRVPRIEDLETIDTFSGAAPFTFQTNFPTTLGGPFWSSSTYLPGTTLAWGVDYNTSYMGNYVKTNSPYLRCVSGTYNPAPVYTDNGDGTVTDKSTGLIWQKCSMGQNNDANCSGTATTDTWANALIYCNGLSLAGKTWRLPNVNEFESIQDLNITPSPAAIDNMVFPATALNYYWASSTNGGNTTNAWYVHFGLGFVVYSPKTNLYNARCVTN